VVFVVFSLSVNARAQIGFVDGYVITTANDTVRGLISDRGNMGNSAVCKFKESKKSNVTTYLPGEIKSYRFNDGKYYKSLEVIDKDKKKLAFAEVLLEGEVSLYYYWKNSDVKYYIEKNSGLVHPLPIEIITLKNKSIDPDYTQRSYSFEIVAYKDTLESIFKDCSALIPKIEEVDYTTADFMEITKEYLNCNDGRSDRIGYEKKLERVEPSFGVFSGVQLSKVAFLESDINSNFSSSVPFGLFYNVPIPWLNDRISFQVELYANRLNYNTGFNNIPSIYESITISNDLVALPLMIKYSLPLGRLSPTVGIGKEFAYIFNSDVKTEPRFYFTDNELENIVYGYRQRGFYLHDNQMGGWFLDIGLEYKLGRKFSVYSNLRFQSNLNLIIEEQSFSNHMFYVAEKKNFIDNPHSNIYRTYAGTLFVGLKF
jgi:hypothetical protein